MIESEPKRIESDYPRKNHIENGGQGMFLSPFETVGKLDCWETYKGIRAVYQAKTGIVEK